MAKTKMNTAVLCIAVFNQGIQHGANAHNAEKQEACLTNNSCLKRIKTKI